jgi:hypothetical protein
MLLFTIPIVLVEYAPFVMNDRGPCGLGLANLYVFPSFLR